MSTPDPEDDDFEKYCYARMILHHPFHSLDILKGGYQTWIAAYKHLCLGHNHIHLDDTLPRSTDNDAEVDDSDTESITEENDEAQETYVAEWMREAGRAPNNVMEAIISALGRREIDEQYNWVLASPQNGLVIRDASNWISDNVKESPNDTLQVLPDVDYRLLKGEQRNVFLQVIAYVKKKLADENSNLPPLWLNVDGTAGTGKSFLIWAISTAIRQLLNITPTSHDPVASLDSLATLA
ncbi:hypothetical protein ONZ45_g9349 [Pleurotus djamor]|nr:hypothetical protein ONZ45_g9349 [Pleurotus djamor]